MAKIEPLTDATQFLDVLAKSELLSMEALVKLRGVVSGSTDATALARQLIKDGTLTRWQASQLLRQYSALTIGPYRLLDQIGKGPTGRVYLAEHGKLGKKVALKVLPGRFSSQPEVLKRFLDEANRAGALNHRNLIHIFDVGSDNDRYFLSVEYVDGKDFQKLVESGGPVGSPQAIGLMRQVAEGLAHAHEQGLTHGDLKPSGLLVDAGGVAKILDLGLSGLADNPIAGEGGEESTESPTLASLAFRAPELLSGSQRSDVRSDLYSLGAVLFFLLTGKPPPRNAAEVAKALDQTPGITPELANLCDHLLAENPAERPESAAQVAAALELAARAAGSAEKPADRPSSPGKPPAKKPLVARPLEDQQAPAVKVSADESAADDDQPLAGFAIKTGRKRQTAPAAAPAVAAPSPASDASPAPKAPRSASRFPLILAGVIGGGVLVVAAMITIIVLILNRGSSTEVASATQSQPATQTAAASGTPANGEANPEANPEVNPEENPEAPPADAPQGPAPAGEPHTTDAPKAAPGTESPPPTTTTAQPAKTETKTEPEKSAPAPAEPTKTEPTKTEPAKTEPAKTDAKPEPTKTPPPAPPAPPANPFEGFAAAVSLPELESMGKPAPDALAPAALGPVKIPADALCLIKLKGGETAFKPGTKFLLEPAEQGTAERDWEFKLQDAAAGPLVIATMSLKEDQLTFQWTEEAGKQQAAPYLCNCVLSMSAGAGTHQAALRKPVTVEPIAVEANKAVSEKYVLEHAPGGKQIAVEFGPLEGGPAKHKIDPKLELSAFKDFTYLWTGNADNALYLGFKIDVAMPGKLLEVSAMPQYFVPGMMPKPDRYTRAKGNELGEIAARGQKAAEFAELVASKTKGDKKKQQDQQAKGVRDLADKTAGQVEQIKEAAKALEGGARLHFRASYLAEDFKVELISTGGPPPAAAPAAPKQDDAKKK